MLLVFTWFEATHMPAGASSFLKVRGAMPAGAVRNLHLLVAATAPGRVKGGLRGGGSQGFPERMCPPVRHKLAPGDQRLLTSPPPLSLDVGSKCFSCPQRLLYGHSAVMATERVSEPTM